MIDEEVKKNDDALLKHEQERNESLREIGNHLHESCIVSNDEVSYKRVKGDEALLKHEQERNESLREIGNHLHESCIVSNDEVSY